MKNKDFKNYIILLCIMAVTFIGCFYLLSWYKQYNDAKLGTPVISDTVSSITYDDIDMIVKERELLFVYLCTSSDTKCRNFEAEFKKYIDKKNLRDYVVYLNLGYDSDENNILQSIYYRYKHKDLIKKVTDYPTILVFSEGKIVDLLSPSKESDVNIKSVKQFLSGYEI